MFSLRLQDWSCRPSRFIRLRHGVAELDQCPLPDQMRRGSVQLELTRCTILRLTVVFVSLVHHAVVNPGAPP
jgi:hypothetical protein